MTTTTMTMTMIEMMNGYKFCEREYCEAENNS
jgi:hypothetical protein